MRGSKRMLIRSQDKTVVTHLDRLNISSGVRGTINIYIDGMNMGNYKSKERCL